MVLFDASVIAIAFDKDATVPLDPETGKPLTHAKERVDLLMKALSDGRTQIVIPTPALSEYMVRGGKNKSQRLQIFQTSKVFAIRDFDTMAAVECATLNDPALNSGKRLDDGMTYAKLKFDRQIIAIAKAHRVTTIYTGDKTLAYVAEQNGIKAVLTWRLPLPAKEAQSALPFETAEEKAKELETDEKTTEPATATKAPYVPSAKPPEAEKPIVTKPAEPESQSVKAVSGSTAADDGSGTKADAGNTTSTPVAPD